MTLRAPNARDAQDYECPLLHTTVRLVRVVTPNCRIHIVMTSLLDTVFFSAAAFAALYHSRWRIDEAFLRIKHRLGFEHSSGLSRHVAQQDFGAKAVCDNLNALAAYGATDTHLDPESSYKIKRQGGRWLLLGTATTRSLNSLMQELAAKLQEFVPDRSKPRKPQRKPHRSHAYKPS